MPTSYHTPIQPIHAKVTKRNSHSLQMEDNSSLFNSVSRQESGLSEVEFQLAETLMLHQTMVFYMDIIAALQEILQGYHQLNILDVGARTGAGANLLGYIFSGNSYSRIKADVTALDIEDRFLVYAKKKFPWISSYIVKDINDLGGTWDIVVCSHTIEHVPNYREFIDKLRMRAKKFVVLLAPYNEAGCKLIKDIKMCEGHINSIDHDAIAELEPQVLKIYRSLVWQQSLAFLAVIPGYADKA